MVSAYQYVWRGKSGEEDVRIFRAGGPVPDTPDAPSLGVASRSWSSFMPRRGSGPDEARLPPIRRSGKKSREVYEFLTAFCRDTLTSRDATGSGEKGALTRF